MLVGGSRLCDFIGVLFGVRASVLHPVVDRIVPG